MPEIGTSGSMSEDEKRSDATWPQRPRSSSTLPSHRFTPARRLGRLRTEPDIGPDLVSVRPSYELRLISARIFLILGRKPGHGQRRQIQLSRPP